MKALMVPLAGLGLMALAGETASAASPAYCALYAREYANYVVQPGAAAGMSEAVQDQAYYRCLNQDEDPELPTASAYFGTGVDAIGLSDSAVAPLGEGDVSGDDVAVVPTGEEPAAPVKQAPRKAVSGGGKLVAWSPEWIAQCKKYYPNSFDPRTGTVLPYTTTTRRLCPY